MNAKMVVMCVWLLQHHWSRCCAVGDGGMGSSKDKRSAEPLMRRSPLDKNFMRFGRSWSEPEDRVSPAGDIARPGRSKPDNFIRFGRAGNGNNNFMRFGRPDKNSNFIRFGRGKPENFMRFGRDKQQNFMRFGRDKLQNFMRFGRDKQQNFMRFGRGVNEDTARSQREDYEEEPRIRSQTKSPSEARENNFLTFGKREGNNFMRFGRSHLEGRHEHEVGGQAKNAEPVSRYDSNDPGNAYIRFGRSAEQDEQEPFLADIMKRSVSKDPLLDFLESTKGGFTDDIGDANELMRVHEFYADDPDSKSSYSLYPPYLDSAPLKNVAQPMLIRKKRSLGEIIRSSPSEACQMAGEPMVTQNHFDHFQSPLAAGLPNFIVGPEFSLLPLLDSSSRKLKRGKPASRNFMRLG